MQNTYQDLITDIQSKNPQISEKLEGGKKFKLVSDFKPAGDQPKAIKKLIQSANKGEFNQVLLGVTGSGKTFLKCDHRFVRRGAVGVLKDFRFCVARPPLESCKDPRRGRRRAFPSRLLLVLYIGVGIALFRDIGCVGLIDPLKRAFLGA